VLDRVIRAVMIVVLAVFAWFRFREYGFYLVKPLWFVESLIYLVLIVAYVVRILPVERSQGWREIIVPLVGAALPFTLLFSPPVRWLAGSHGGQLAIFWFMAVSTSLTVVSMWTLRRSFSITVEARSLVGSGPYRWIRHPIYLGEMLSAVAVTLWRLSLANVMLCAAFIAVQLWRARMEERKLGRLLPEYAAFARSRWWPVSFGPHE
jgi:protein-S-isoprenylcysteine O-methyltransferase Ste14